MDDRRLALRWMQPDCSVCDARGGCGRRCMPDKRTLELREIALRHVPHLVTNDDVYACVIAMLADVAAGAEALAADGMDLHEAIERMLRKRLIWQDVAAAFVAELGAVADVRLDLAVGQDRPRIAMIRAARKAAALVVAEMLGPSATEAASRNCASRH